jgi:hypothetical protein
VIGRPSTTWPRRVGGRVLRGVEVGVVELAPRQVVAQRHALVGEVRVEERERVALQVVAALRATETRLPLPRKLFCDSWIEVVRPDSCEIAQAEHEAARRGFLDRVDDVDLVVWCRDAAFSTSTVSK